MLHQMLSNNPRMDWNLVAAAKLFHRLQHRSQGSSAECSSGQGQDRGCGNSPVTLAHSSFFGPCCQEESQGPSTKDLGRQATAAVAATPRQLLVTCHVAAGEAQDQRTKGRRDVTKNAKQAQHSPLFLPFFQSLPKVLRHWWGSLSHSWYNRVSVIKGSFNCFSIRPPFCCFIIILVILL